MLATHLAAYVAHRTLLRLVDAGVHRWSRRHARFLSRERAPPAARRTLVVNSAIEHAFLWRTALLLRTLPPISPWAPLCFYALFILDDALYTPFHRLLHAPWLYERIHRQHHARGAPTDGYSDAADEHPLEQAGALAIHFGALCLLRALGMLDAAAALGHLLVKAVGSCLNHVGYDARVPLGCGVVLSARYHRAHHTHLRCNYSQFVPAVDRCVAGVTRRALCLVGA